MLRGISALDASMQALSVSREAICCTTKAKMTDIYTITVTIIVSELTDSVSTRLHELSQCASVGNFLVYSVQVRYTLSLFT